MFSLDLLVKIMITIIDFITIAIISISIVIVGSLEMDERYRLRFVDDYKQQMSMDAFIVGLILIFMFLVYNANI